jgi:glyoxylase-like metal-dependent hydrolase (beta-lactamase superfamily II)
VEIDLIEYAEVISEGDGSGNEMVVRFRLPSGLEVFGLPTQNAYGGHWDLGPTWNYAVMADRPFLVDAGKFGQGSRLLAMMETAGISHSDMDFVVISHSHEDHDGGLAELIETTRLKVKAHAIYDRLIRHYPAQSPEDKKKHFPAKCWHCFMPESFYAKNCLEYHRVLQGLKIDVIGDGYTQLGPDVCTYHLPGHSPDCLALRLGEEALIVGDIILPDISPWPTRKAMFCEVAQVIKPAYTDAAAIFGLDRYIRSLKTLIRIADDHPGLLVFPAHRLYYNDCWKPIDLATRARKLLAHHIDRCGAIVEILNGEPKAAEEIAAEYFEDRLLEGFGILMATNEIVSHCELLIESGDVITDGGDRFTASGTMKFEAHINNSTADEIAQ